MKEILALTLAAVICSPVASARPRRWQIAPLPTADATPWVVYTHPGEEFSVAMPRMAVLHDTFRAVKDRPKENGKARAFAAYADGVVYLIWSYDAPRPGEDVAHFAQYFRSSQLSRDVKVDGRGEARLGDFVGRRYAITDERFPVGDNEFSFYVYRARKHAYVVAAYGAGEGSAAVRRFFESFDLSGGPAGARAADAAPPPTGGQLQERAKGAGIGTGYGCGVGTGYPLSAADNAPVDYTRVFRPSEVTRKAVPVFRPEPPYTEVARKDNVTGTVRLRMAFNSDGTVSNIVAVSRLPHGLTENAVAAARQIKFIPAEKDGRRVSQWVTVQYNFNIY